MAPNFEHAILPGLKLVLYPKAEAEATTVPQGLELSSAGARPDWVFVVMCRARQGDAAAARSALASAAAWHATARFSNPIQRAQHKALIQKVRALLDSFLLDLPPSVFDL